MYKVVGIHQVYGRYSENGGKIFENYELACSYMQECEREEPSYFWEVKSIEFYDGEYLAELNTREQEKQAIMSPLDDEADRYIMDLCSMFLKNLE